MPLPWEQSSSKTVIDTIGALVVLLDHQGRIVEFNRACEQLTGYAKNEAMGRVLWDFLLLPEEQRPVQAVFDALRAGDFPNQFENHWVTKTGATRLITWSNTALLDAHGQVEIIVGTGIDISERKRTEEALRRRDAILEAVAFAAEEFLKTTDWERSIQDVLARLAAAATATHAYLIQITGEKTATPLTLVRSAWTAPGTTPLDISDLKAEHFVSLEPWRDLLLQGQSIHGSVKDLLAFRQTPLGPSLKTVAIVPVFLEGQIWGVMGFGHSDLEHDWKVPEVDALRAAASTFGAALERWQNVEQRQARERFLTTLANITQMSMQIPEIEAMLQALADRITDIIDADDCYITLWDAENRQSIPIAASASLRKAFQATGRKPAEDSVTGATLRLGQTLVVEDIMSSNYVSVAVAEQFSARSGIALPLMAGAEPLGAIFLTFRKPHRFSPEEIARCEQATQQVALAIAKARLLHSEQAARKRAEILQRITEALSSSIHLRDVLDTMMTELQRVLPYDSASIQEIQGNHAVIIACRGFPNHYQIMGMRFDLRSERTPNRQVILSRQPLVLPDAPGSFEDFGAFPHAPASIRSWLGVPLIIGGEVLGMISLDKQIPNYYTSEHRDLALAFAAQAAIAIQNAQLFVETQRRAVQQEALNTIITAAATALDLPSLVATTMDRILTATGLQQGAIWAAGHYHRVDIPKELMEAIGEYRSERQTKIPVTLAIEDWSDDDLPELVQWMAKPALAANIQSSFFTPVMAAGRSIGGLVLCSSTPRLWPPEEVLLLQAVAQQVGTAAQRLHLAQEVRQQAQQLQQVLDTVTDGMLLLDSQRRIVLANPAGRDYLKLLCQEQIGDAIEQIGRVPIGAFLETNASPTWRELIVEHPEWRIFQANARPVEIMPGQANAGWVLSITEITQERRRQEKVQAQERLAALGRMAAGIAHDFNNILQGIIGFADIIAKQPGLNESTRRRVERISQEGHRGADLVRQILDFSRQSPPNLQPVAMEALVPYFADLWRGTFPPEVHLTIEIQDTPCVVAADTSQLSHVFTNLAVNGVEAMPQGGTLAVHLWTFTLSANELAPIAEMHAGDWVAVSIRDSGCGIAANDLPRVFEPFFTTKRTGRSAGLGLARAYGIIQQHGGYVTLDSQMNVGTTVTVYLPAFAPPDLTRPGV